MGSNLEKEIDKVKDEVSEMMSLVLTQLEKTRDCLFNMDQDLAYEIENSEVRVDAMELSIEKSCGNLIALQNPVASDMRFILSMLRMINDLERIGDNANGIANMLTKDHIQLKQEILSDCRIDAMLSTALIMLNTVYNAFLDDNSKTARKIFKLDLEINAIFLELPVLLQKQFENKRFNFSDSLHLYAIGRKIERTGDLVKNLGESIIYHLEAKNIKHKAARKAEK